jgi:hypothetical protein
MSYQAKLGIEHYSDKGYSQGIKSQLSPLIFGDSSECRDFAVRMFARPESVKSFEIVSTDKPANATMKNGKVRML